MSSVDATLKKVCELLGMLPGVVVSNSGFDGKRAKIEVVVSNVESMLALQKATEGANAGFRPWLRLVKTDTAIAPTTCVIGAGTESFTIIKCGFLQLLGIHLVWHLHYAGTMPAPAANKLLRRWRGDPVEA